MEDHLEGATDVEERIRPEVQRAEEGVSGKARGRKETDGVQGVGSDSKGNVERVGRVSGGGGREIFEDRGLLEHDGGGQRDLHAVVR